MSKFWFACILLVVIIFSGFIVDRIAFFVGGPLWTFRSYLANDISSFISYFESKSSLQKQVDSLQKEVDEKNAQVISIRNENELYKSLDRYISLHEIKAGEVPIRVVTRPPQTPYDEIIAYVGTTSASIGTTVYFSDLPVGTVTNFDAGYVRISLFSNPDSKFKVVIGPNKIDGEASGLGAGNILVKIPRDSAVKENDLIYMSSSTSPFSTVSKVDSDISQSFMNVYIRLPFSPLRVDWLTIRDRKI